MAFRGCDPNTLKQFLRDSGLQYAENTQSYIFTCPRCQRPRKLFVSKRSGRFVCWRCGGAGYKGRPEYALSDLLGVPVKEVQARLYGGEVPVETFLHVVIADFFGDGDELDEEALAVQVPILHWPEDYYPIEDAWSARGAEYLRGRGIPLWLATKYGLRYAPVEQRVVFPIADGDSLYGWQGRLIIPTTYTSRTGETRELLKIRSSKDTPRERLLMFVDRLMGSDHAVLCEGPVDALKAHFCGGNVCSMGKSVSQEQMRVIVQSGVKKLYLALDPDAASETRRLVRQYSDDVELYEMIAPARGGDKADLGAMDFDEVYDLFLGARRIPPGRIHVFFDARVLGPRK